MNEEYQKDFIENRKKMINEMSDTEKEEMMKGVEMPSMDDLMKMINSMGGVTDEDREKIRDRLLKRAGYQYSDNIPAENVDSIPPATAFEIISLVVYLILLISFICAFVFFGYKLYKSLVERDRKREEKLKAKQSKKKK